MRKIKSVSAVLCFVAFFSALVTAQVKVGMGSYWDENRGFAVPSAEPSITPGFSKHVRSNTWWVTLMTRQHSDPFFSHPLSFKTTSGGLEIGYPGSASPAADGFYVRHSADLTVGVNGLNSSAARVASHSHWTVTAAWSGGNTAMEATMGSGMPFVFFKITGGDAAIDLNNGSIWENQGSVLGVNAGGHYYAIFGPSGCTWSGTSSLRSSLAGKDYLSVALLPDNSPATLAFFKKYAYSFVVDTKVEIAYQEETARLNALFRFYTEQKEGTQTGTMYALMRHQWLDAASPLRSETYKSVRGLMKVGEGDYFTVSMVFNGILPAMPEIGYDKNTLNGMLETLSGDAGATYAKNLGRAGTMANIADQAGDIGRRDDIVDNLKGVLERWFTADGNNRVFYYHKPWHRLTGYPGGFYSDTRLTDHHFHYGYFLEAAAVVAKYDPDWARPENWGGMVEMLVRDINSWDDEDPLFSRWSYFDPYEGHGWADGMGFDRGNNQESSSESMNFNASLIMWGVNTGNKVLRDLGIFMYASETRAIEQYWWDVDGAVFPDGYSHTAVGMVWSNGGAYGTWFSGSPGAIHGINILPITPGSLYMGRRPDYIPKNFDEGFTGQWADLFHEFLVFSDPQKAMARTNNGRDRGNGDGGNTQAYFYHHMNSVAAAGRLSTVVTADIPTFAVFDKDQTRTYTAYNPNPELRTVAFNDGFTMDVPPRTQVTKQGTVQNIIAVSRSLRPEVRRNERMRRIISLAENPADLQGREIFTTDGRKAVLKLSGTPDGIYILKAGAE